ncbi:MAG: oxidative damage protection protein [Gammaproteobacteria bacterium]|nr:oxidative damage protection protein [Gammaproteobacteria bacterium]
MTRIVKCSLLGSEAEGLEKAPYPGELGQRIYDNVSKDAWQQWLERLVMIINEYQLNSADLGNQLLIEQHLVGFLFQEGEFGQAPSGFSPAP